MSDPLRTADRILACVLLGYGLANLTGIALSQQGLIHPPWVLLGFFTFVGPFLGILLLCLCHFSVKPRRFSSVGFGLALLSLTAAMPLNFLIIVEASGAC